jgi:hypothetical protein
VKIELLYVPGCPNYGPALERLQKVLASESLQAEVCEVSVRTSAQASRLSFLGSPTIRKNGEDIDFDGATIFGLSCRLYANQSGIPSEEALRSAVLRAKVSL